MKREECKYYAYDTLEHEFIKEDGKLAEVSESFVKDMGTRMSFMLFVKKDDVGDVDNMIENFG